MARFINAVPLRPPDVRAQLQQQLLQPAHLDNGGMERLAQLRQPQLAVLVQVSLTRCLVTVCSITILLVARNIPMLQQIAVTQPLYANHIKVQQRQQLPLAHRASIGMCHPEAEPVIAEPHPQQIAPAVNTGVVQLV